MSTSELAQQYLTPAQKTFWQWSKGGREIEWIDGSTIAFREEVLVCLRRLQDDGFAPFDMVLLLLAVLRSSWTPDANRLAILTDVFGSGSKMMTAQWEETLKALEQLASLPDELKSSTEAKAELIAMVLGKHKLRATPEISKAVIEEVRQGFPYDVEPVEEFSKSAGDWIRELRGVCDGVVRVNEEKLRFQLATNVPSPPDTLAEVEDLEKIPAVGLKPFLKQLETDEELGGMAKLTHQLMAVVHLPRQIQDQDDLPLGGVSDISNRGPLDRLLISELANDDETLMTRVALREALYMRRETSVSNPPQRRMIFLDVGLRMWGVPRIFATSVALSLAAMTENNCEMFHAKGDDVQSIEFKTREGLMDYLGKLEPEIHPGAALAEFRCHVDVSQDEVVYVLGEDVYADEDFRRMLREQHPETYYVAAVSRSGRFRMYSYTQRGERQIREALLDLNVLYGTRKHKVEEELIDRRLAEELPAIIRLKKLPLRLSHSLSLNEVLKVNSTFGDKESSVLAISHDQRLMWWDSRQRGARQLLGQVPSGMILAANFEMEIVRVVVGRHDSHNRCLIWFDSNSLECRSFPLECSMNGLNSAAIHNGIVMLIFDRSIQMYYGTDGKKCASFPLHDLEWIGSRFFKMRNSSLVAMSYDGKSPRIEKLADYTSRPHSVFDSSAANGPVILYGDGSYQVPPKELVHPRHGLTSPVRVDEVSQDGNHISLSGNAPGQRAVIRLSDDSVVTDRNSRAPLFRRAAINSLAQRSLRVKLTGIGAYRGDLIIRNRKGKPLCVRMAGEQLELTPIAQQPELNKNFDRVSAEYHGRFRIQKARWKDGSMAFLDSRGMLHLRSSDSSIPELSLVLYDRNLSGWCADGTCFGDSYFLIDGYEKCSSRTIYQEVIQPFVARLR